MSLVAVDETEESVRAAEVAHRLFGEEPEYVAVNVVEMVTDSTGLAVVGAGWGVSYPVTYGSAWTYRSMEPSVTNDVVRRSETPVLVVK